MSIKIRFARGGAKKRPFYKVVAADARAPRDGKFIEAIGFYNPLLPKDHQDALRVNADLLKKWLQNGAEPTERVQKLLASLGLYKAPELRPQPKKSALKAKALEKKKAEEEKAAAKAEAEAKAKAEAEEAAKAAAEEAAKAAEAPAEEVKAEEVKAEETPATETPAEGA